MAYSNVVSRLSSRLQPFALKLGKRSLSLLKSCSQSQASSSASASAGRFSRISRLPLELSSVETMIPLHSAIASARLVSSLSIDSQSWTLVPQVYSHWPYFGLRILQRYINAFMTESGGSKFIF